MEFGNIQQGIGHGLAPGGVVPAVLRLRIKTVFGLQAVVGVFCIIDKAPRGRAGSACGGHPATWWSRIHPGCQSLQGNPLPACPGKRPVHPGGLGVVMGVGPQSGDLAVKLRSTAAEPLERPGNLEYTI